MPCGTGWKVFDESEIYWNVNRLGIFCKSYAPKRVCFFMRYDKTFLMLNKAVNFETGLIAHSEVISLIIYKRSAVATQRIYLRTSILLRYRL